MSIATPVRHGDGDNYAKAGNQRRQKSKHLTRRIGHFEQAKNKMLKLSSYAITVTPNLKTFFMVQHWDYLI